MGGYGMSSPVHHKGHTPFTPSLRASNQPDMHVFVFGEHAITHVRYTTTGLPTNLPTYC